MAQTTITIESFGTVGDDNVRHHDQAVIDAIANGTAITPADPSKACWVSYVTKGENTEKATVSLGSNDNALNQWVDAMPGQRVALSAVFQAGEDYFIQNGDGEVPDATRPGVYQLIEKSLG